MATALTSTNAGLSVIVLAAGGSTRLGQPKQLLKLRGTTLLLRATRLARQVTAGEVVVVLGDQQQRLRSLLRRSKENPTVVHNAHWKDGLATSLRAGLKRVSPAASAVLILLVDQALLGAKDLARLTFAWQRRPARPAAAYYSGSAGAPAIIPRSLFGEILKLEGDAGARRLLRGLPELTLVEIPAAEFDIDTPEQALKLRA